jgi:hypothetical protein
MFPIKDDGSNASSSDEEVFAYAFISSFPIDQDVGMVPWHFKLQMNCSNISSIKEKRTSKEKIIGNATINKSDGKFSIRRSVGTSKPNICKISIDITLNICKKEKLV